MDHLFLTKGEDLSLFLQRVGPLVFISVVYFFFFTIISYSNILPKTKMPNKNKKKNKKWKLLFS